MWECRKCSKPVYFAERKQSLGFDWHPNCLRCEECGKRLNPGQHAEHRGVPFCHHPCYGALFGPQLFGHGTRNECHTSFGKIENRDGEIKRTHLEARLKAYNSLYDGKPGELKSREVNGRFILEGVLRIYWGVKNTIHLKQEDDSRMIAARRQISLPYYSDSDDEIDNTVWRDDSPNQIKVSSLDQVDVVNHHKRPTTLQTSNTGTSELDCQEVVDHEGNSQANTLPLSNRSVPLVNEDRNGSSVLYYSVDSHLDTRDADSRGHNRRNGSTAIRRRPGRRMNKSRLKRRCSINGHYYLRETSSFTPPYGSPCSIWITSKTTAEEVLNMLLEKYKVEMSTFNFALFIVKDSGELRRIKEDESPLIARVMLGPHEDVSKVFIMDAQRTQEVSHEVAQFLNLSIAECRAILAKYEQEEANQVKVIKKK